MTLLLTLLIMAVIGLVAAVAAGRIGGGLDEPASSLPGRGLPPGPFTLEDVGRVRFSPALRGYRMDEVDDVVDRLVDRVAQLEDEVAVLRSRYRPGDQVGYEPVGYDQPGYDQPGYDQPGYDQPGYDQPGYDQPGYDQPGRANGWADAFGDYRRPAPTARDDDGGGEH